MERPACIDIAAHDLGGIVDSDGLGESGPWGINSAEGSLIQEKTMLRSARIVYTADLPARIDPDRLSERGGARKIDGGERALVQEIAMKLACGISISAKHLSSRIDTLNIGK